MSSLCHIFLVRHAQSEGNAAKIVQGHADFPLSQLGFKQARARADQLKQIQFTECFASDLLRTKQTAEVLSQSHVIPVRTTPLLREQNFGKFNGSPADVFEREIDAVVARHRQLPPSVRLQQRAHPEIESDGEMMWRMMLFLRSAASANLGSTILTVSHGGIMRSLLVSLNYASFEQMTHTAIGNCGYIQLDSDGEHFTVAQVADITITPPSAILTTT